MVGVIVYIYFLVLGFLYADLLFKDKAIFTKVWIGGILGNLILMAGIVPLSFVCGFNIISHLLLIVIAAVPYVIVSIRKKELCIIQNKKLALNTDLKGGEMNLKLFLCLVLPVAAVICILMFNHILFVKDGNYYSGQSTYGDLQMHLGFISSMAEQGTFPPPYPFLAGVKNNYPFFVDMLSSSLMMFGTTLRWATLTPSFVFAFLVVMGFYHFAYALTEKKSVAVLSTVFFFLCGAFGFAYFFEGAKADPKQFTRFFTEYYQTPTNLNDNNIRWSNTICDMIIPQRTTMAGWTYILFELYLLMDALKKSDKVRLIILGVVAGCMPMIHTHSFLALGIISAVMVVIELVRAKDKKASLINWLWFGGIALVLALPQLILWTFSQTGNNESFLNFQFNWVNHNDPYWWFYIKNWGLVFLFIVPAFLNTSRRNKELMVAAAVIFALAEFIKFQPNEYDNNKLFYITYMFALVLCTEFFVSLYEKLKGIKARQYIAALVIITMTLSGVLTIIREWRSGGEYQTFSKSDIEYAEFIKANTEKNAVFLTGSHHTNPVVTLAGRNIYCGSSLYVYFHGLGDEWQKRSNEVKSIYASDYAHIKAFAEKNNISYISVTNTEKTDCNANISELSKFEKVYDKNNIALYKVN